MDTSNITKVKEELLPKCKVFFDSIEEQLIYREKYFFKYRLFDIITAISTMIMVFSLIPLIPYFVGKIEWFISLKPKAYGYLIDLGNFYIRWILISAFSLILYFIIKPFNSYLDKKENKYTLSSRHLSFAFLYKSIKALDVFLINGHKENIRISSEYLEKYYSRCFINSNLRLSTEIDSLYLPDLLTDLKKSRSWIQLSELTETIIQAFDSFDEKIKRRINEKIEIDLVLGILNLLLCYEYLHLDKVSKEKIKSVGDLGQFNANQFLSLASEALLAIDSIEPTPQPKASSTLEKLEKSIINIGELFTHSSIVITFISWLVLLSLIVTGVVYFGITTVGIKLDSTLFIGAVSAVLVGAITFSATIYTKRKSIITNNT